jgi:putative DNA primase/helicase
MKQLNAEQSWQEGKSIVALNEEEPINVNALNIGELMALDLPERPRHLPWLREGGLAMIYGPRGLGKTFFSLGLGLSLVTGESFIRWPITKPVGVLIIDGEMMLTDLRERITRMLLTKPAALLQIISHEVVFENQERDLDFGSKLWQNALEAHLDDNPDIKVIILDNLSCLLPSIREDKRDDWSSKVMPWIIRLRRRGISLVLIHHAGKGGDQRGTSSREDQLDTVIKLSPLPDADPTRGAQFRVSFSKSRGCYGSDVEDIEAYLTEIDGIPEWTWSVVEESNSQRLLNLIREGVDNVTDASVELDLTKGAVSKLKKKLVTSGDLKPGVKLVLAND